MINRHIYTEIIVFTLCLFMAASCSLVERPVMTILDAKTVTALDENLMPVSVTDTFKSGTSKVGCWIKWQNAKVNTQLEAKWHYITDDIHILDHTLNIPKKDGNGGVTLSMPAGKTLPSGLYKVELVIDRRVIKTLKFMVK